VIAEDSKDRLTCKVGMIDYSVCSKCGENRGSVGDGRERGGRRGESRKRGKKQRKRKMGVKKES
jgi:hypothetical protein